MGEEENGMPESLKPAYWTRSWIDIIKNYRDGSSAHGVRYVLDFESKLAHRILWALVMMGSMGLGIYSSVTMFLAWQKAPVLTTFSSDDLPISSLEFPSVILCSPGNNMAALPNISLLLSEEWEAFWKVKNSTVLESFQTTEMEEQEKLITQFVMHYIPGWPSELSLEHFMLYMTTHLPSLTRTLLLWSKEPEFRNQGVPVFDLLINPARRQEYHTDMSSVEKSTEKMFENMDFTSNKAQEIMLNVLWFTAQPCRNLLLHCSWRGYKVPCEKMFYLIPTDIGFCCAFNHNRLSKMLRRHRLTRIIEKMEDKFSLINGERRNDSADVDYSPKWGIQNGLTVVIDTKSEWNPSSVRQDFLGIRGALKGKNQFPIMSRDSFLIRPGHETFASITATHMTARSDLRSLPLEKRKCYFPDEFHLELFQSYSVKNCWMEAFTNFSRMMTVDGCVPWNFPSPDKGVPVCKPRERQKFLEAFRTADIDQQVVERCLPNCGGTTYDMSVTTAPFRNCDQANMGLTRLCNIDFDITPQKWADEMIDSYLKHGGGNVPDYVLDLIKSPQRKFPEDKIFDANNNKDRVYNAFDRDIAVATFFYPRHTATELVKAPKMSTLDFMSQVGGILGLCVGISLISVVEIVYWVFMGMADSGRSLCRASEIFSLVSRRPH